MRVEVFFVTLVIFCFLGPIATDAQNPRFDDSPAERISEGVFANFSYPVRPALAHYEAFKNSKAIVLQDGLLAPKFDDTGRISRVGFT